MQSIDFLHSDFWRCMLGNEGKVPDSYGKCRLVRAQDSKHFLFLLLKKKIIIYLFIFKFLIDPTF